MVDFVHLPEKKNTIPNIIAARDAKGAPRPIPISPKLAKIPSKNDAGIRISMDDISPLISENVV